MSDRAPNTVQTRAPKRVLICGGSGLIGGALIRHLARAGCDVAVLVRRPPRPRPEPGVVEIEWHPEASVPVADPALLEGCAAAVNLAGAGIGSHLWTRSYRRQILDSRVGTCRALGSLFAALSAPPPALVAASAVGYYGDRGDQVLDEDAPSGRGFLAEVCRAWEASAAGLAPRVAHMRFGIVLSSRGGALRRMLPVFRAGLGGRLGRGRQWMSWISLADAVSALALALDRGDLGGAFNVTAPYPVTNAEFTHALSAALRRPAWLRVPALALRAALGEMAEELLLSSTRAVPRRLCAAGLRFSHERLEHALMEMV
jgi:uncharacterized protein (TIGR01777 family)